MQTSVKGDIWRAIRAGRLPAQRKDDGGFEIDPAELSRVFEPQRPDERPMGQDATASTQPRRVQQACGARESAETPIKQGLFYAAGVIWGSGWQT